ncbi:unnamed protein product [Boreogadus saida]
MTQRPLDVFGALKRCAAGCARSAPSGLRPRVCARSSPLAASSGCVSLLELGYSNPAGGVGYYPRPLDTRPLGHGPLYGGCVWVVWGIGVRSRWAQFQWDCQPSETTASGCTQDNYGACLLAYTGLIGWKWRSSGWACVPYGEGGVVVMMEELVVLMAEAEELVGS